MIKLSSNTAFLCDFYLTPSTVDNSVPGELGTVRFEWLMDKPPETRKEALSIREKARRIPFLNGTLISEDGKAICLYLPLTSKDLSYRVYSLLKKKIVTFSGDERYFVTGLPVAEDTFGVEMFIPQKSLENFGLTSNQAETFSFMTRFLRKTGCITFHHVKIVLVLTGVIVIIAVWGISRIRINDNPIKWFARSHPIRIADQVLNEHFGGTYMAYLVLEPQAAGKDLESYRRDLVLRLSERSSELKGAYPLAPQIFTEIIDLLKEKEEKVATPEGILNNLIHLAEDRLNRSRGDAAYIWEETSLFWRG